MNVSQGTISVLFGCHSIIHSILVLISWVKLYGKFPKFWQFVCILIHDMGHLGLDYLDNFEQKRGHWKLGAKLGFSLFGLKGFFFIAGHSRNSGIIESDLCKPDKYSWYIAPRWWLLFNTIVEPKIVMGYNRFEAVRLFRQRTRENITSGEFGSNHKMFLQRCKGV